MPMLAAAGVSLAGSLYGAYQNQKANEQQQDAASAALDKQIAATEAERQRQMEAAGQANTLVGQYSQQGQDQLRQSMGLGQEYLQQGFGQARTDLGQYYDQARGDLSAGDQLAMGRLGAGVAGARNDLYAGMGAAQGTLNQTAGNSRLAALMNGGLQAGFQADPGYQFRQQQGEQALARRAAASGGRLGGAAMKSLADFNSGLASQEFGNYANRAIGMASSEDARQAGLMGQLAQMQYGTGGQLAQGQMQQGLAGAGYGMNLGQNLGQMALGQGSNLANLATGQGNALSNLQMQGGTNLAQMMMGTGQQMGANLMTGAGAGAALTQSMLNQYNNPVGYAGAGTAAMGQGINQAAQGMASLISSYGGGGFGGGGASGPAYGDSSDGGYFADPNATWVQGA